MCSHTLFAQLNSDPSSEYDTYYTNFYLINSAACDTNYQWKIALNNKQYVGVFEGINRMNADFSHQKLISDGGNRRFLGLQLNRYNEGEFIHRTKVFLRYALALKLSAKSYLSMGLSPGLVNYTFDGGGIGGGGSAFVPDLNAGTYYMRSNLKIGLAYMQALNNKIAPVKEQFVLKPYWNIHGVYVLPILARYQVLFQSFVQYNYNQPLFRFTPMLLAYEKLLVGCNWKAESGVALIIGLERIRLLSGECALGGSFFIRTRKLSQSADNAFDLYLNFGI